MAEPNLAIRYVPLDSLVPYARNARTHSKAQIGKLEASLREFGWTTPLLVAGRDILAGHGRLAAAQALRAKGEAPARVVDPATAPVIDLSHLSARQRRAYIIADNRLAADAGWDLELLAEELDALNVEGFDLALTGFDAPELNRMLSGAGGNTEPDDAPPPPANPISRLGDLWLLGKHRIICGDSTARATVAALLGADKPHLMVTDPPYGVEYDADWRNKAARTSAGMGNRALGAGAVGKVMNDDRADWSAAWALFPGDVAYVWQGDKQLADMARQLTDDGFACRNLIVWAKSNFAIGRGDYHPQHETCWYVVRKGATGHWNGDRKQSTLWQIDKPAKSETGHSTQKPVECMQRPIENNSKPGDLVYEPFSGSGTTIIAGQITGRQIRAIELNPAYVDVAVRRWEDFTGEEAILIATGQTFHEVAADRADAEGAAPLPEQPLAEAFAEG